MGHGVAQSGIDGAEVLSHHVDAEALGLNGHDGHQFVEGHRDVGAVVPRPAVGHPEEALKTHDVVEAHDAGDAHVAPERFAKLTVGALAHPFGVGGWRPPTLTVPGHGIGRSSDGETGHPLVGVAPDVVTVGVHPHGNVQLEGLSPLGEASRELVHLLIDDPLGEEVVTHSSGVDVVPTKQSRSSGRRPRAKVTSHGLSGRAESGEVVHLGMLHHVGAQTLLVEGHELTLGRRPGLNDVALRVKGRGRIHPLTVSPGAAGLGSVRVTHQVLGGRRVLEKLHLIEGDVAVVPESPRHRPIGRGLEVVGTEGGQEGQGRHHARPPGGDQGGEGVEVGDVPRSPGTFRVKGEDRRLDRDGAPVVGEAVGSGPQWTNNQCRPRGTLSGHHAEAVVSDAQSR